MATITRRKNGTARIRVSNGYSDDGTQVVFSKEWKPDPNKSERLNEKDLAEAAVLYENEVKNGKCLNGNIKLSNFIDLWLEEHVEEHLALRTQHSYRQMSERISKALGHIQLNKLKAHHIRAFYKELKEEGIRLDIKYKATNGFKEELKKLNITQTALSKLSGTSINTIASCVASKNVNKESAEKIAKALDCEMKKLFAPVDKDRKLDNGTIHYYHRLMSAMLSVAMEMEALVENPMGHVRAPSLGRKKVHYLDDVQARDVLRMLAKEPIVFLVAITLLLYSGLRRGELCGLCWRDINFKNKTIAVNKALIYIPKKGVFDGLTKTVGSERTIRVSEHIIEMLKEYKTWQDTKRLNLMDRWVDEDRVIIGWNGRHIHPDTLTKWFSKFLKKYGLPKATIHSLRHTYATLLIHAKVSVADVADNLGHTNASTANKIYIHAIQAAKAAATEVLDDILNPDKQSDEE